MTKYTVWASLLIDYTLIVEANSREEAEEIAEELDPIDDIFSNEDAEAVAIVLSGDIEVAPDDEEDEEDEDWTADEEHDLLGSQDVDSDPYDVDRPGF